MTRRKLTREEERTKLAAAVERIVAQHGTGYSKPGETLSATIKRQRYWLGMTQRELAVLADVSTKTISDWETGRHRPAPGRTLTSVAIALYIPPEVLMHFARFGPRPH